MTDWPVRYLNLASYVAGWSKDPSTKVGSVIFRPDGSIISLGYNGLPRGADDSKMADRETKLRMVIHAEENAILAAGRNGTPLMGAAVAVTHHPCASCASKLVQSGVRTVWYWADPAFESRWAKDLALSADILSELEVRRVQPPLSGQMIEEFSVWRML